MNRWILTAISFAAVIGVSVYAVRSGAPRGSSLAIPPQAHLLALLAFVVEVAARSFKLTWSAKPVGTKLPLMTSVRTSLGGAFGAADARGCGCKGCAPKSRSRAAGWPRDGTRFAGKKLGAWEFAARGV